MARIDATDLAACGLAAAAAALGYASHTGAMLLLLGIAVVAAGVVRARLALGLASLVVAPLLLVIGRSSASFVAGAICLAGAGLLWLYTAQRSGPLVLGELQEELLATRIVLAGIFLILIGILVRFAQSFSL